MKVIHSKYSSYTGDDIANTEALILNAQADYQAKVDRYNASVALGSGHARWAKRNLLPAVNTAKDYLKNLQDNYSQMLASTGQLQNIDLVDTALAPVDQAATQTDWTTIGLAVGALVVIVIIVKLL